MILGRKGGKREQCLRAQGFVLVSFYMVFSVLSILMAALLERNFGFLQASERNLNKVVAFNMAEAGMNDVLATFQSVSISTAQDSELSVPDTMLGIDGGYNVVVSTPDPLNPQVRQVVATGYAPDNNPNTRAQETRQLIAFAQITPTSPFDQAIFSSGRIHMSGFAQVDSYDSGVAPYDPTNPGTNADVRSNTTTAGDIMFQGGDLYYKGDVIIGPGGIPTDVVSTTRNVYNKYGNIFDPSTDVTVATEPKYYSSAQAPSGLPSAGTLTISGTTTYTIQEGTYVYDSISINGNATLNITGAVTIYVKGGDFNIGGQGTVSVAGNSPANFVVAMVANSSGTTGSVDFNSNALDFQGAIYAPDSTMHLANNAEMYGAVIADLFDQSGTSKFHYDEALKDSELNIQIKNQNKVEVLSWREVNASATVE